jgi:hypothetical protein
MCFNYESFRVSILTKLSSERIAALSDIKEVYVKNLATCTGLSLLSVTQLLQTCLKDNLYLKCMQKFKDSNTDPTRESKREEEEKKLDQ